MASKTRVGGLGRDRSTERTPSGSAQNGESKRKIENSAGTRALLVLVLTPALIFFMSRKDVGHAASRPTNGARVVEQWPSSGFHAVDRPWMEYARRPWGAHPVARYVRESDTRGADLVYARAMFLAGRYDSRPYWRSRKLEAGAPASRETADLAIEHLIPCESMGKSINRVDSNGKMSYGILQFQDWDEWEAVSGLGGDPDNREDAIRMGEWAIENGMINHWTCAQILKVAAE
jgi:hypothetical protein